MLFGKLKKLLVCLLLTTLVLAAGSAAHWSYYGEDGPAHWGELSAEYLACAEGLGQSPINISWDDDDDDDGDDDFSSANKDRNLNAPELTFDYSSSATLDVFNNGHTIQANVPPNSGTLFIGQDAYALAQFHFHTPSEHLLNGDSYAVEMHLVHKNGNDELAVVGVFFNVGYKNAELASLFANLPAVKDAHASVADFDLSAIAPNSSATFRYSGSLTTPPCSEGVRWHVAAVPSNLSHTQYRAFSHLFTGSHFPDGNRRPVQNLNGRNVVLVP